MIFDFHDKCQLDKMFPLDKEKTKQTEVEGNAYLCGYFTLLFQKSLFLHGPKRIMGGDVNAQVGRGGIDNNNAAGEFGYNYTNGQGEELVQWLRENELP